MKRLKFSQMLLLSFSLICLSGCRQGAKKVVKKPVQVLIKDLGGGSQRILLSNFNNNFLEANLKDFSKTEINIFARQLQDNYEFASFISKNPQKLKTWKLLSKTEFSSKPLALNYFDELTKGKEFKLFREKGGAKIINNNNELLAKISLNKII